MVAVAHQPALTTDQVDRYLARLGIDRQHIDGDLDSLRRLQLAHLDQIPFENLDIVFGDGVPHDLAAAVAKITGVDAVRGGWCFELNGPFALLLEAVGFEVRMLGAAVLLGGSNQVIDHLALEVSSPSLDPHLVDVGFGDSFDEPLALNRSGPQDGGSGTFELISSPQGTTLTRHVDGVPHALMRFKRVAHSFGDFSSVARSLQVDPTKQWASHPFCCRRLIDTELASDVGSHGETRRVTLTAEHLKIERSGAIDETPVDQTDWAASLDDWFSIDAALLTGS